MKKLFITSGILIMVFLLPWTGFSQGSEKTIGPITIAQSVFIIDYPQDTIQFTLVAAPSDETHDIRIYFDSIGWLDGEIYHKINGGESKEITVTLSWPYLSPGEIRQDYIKIQVDPDEKPQDRIIDEQAFSVTGIKPGTLNQEHLGIIRDGFPSIEVYFRQISPEEGDSLLNRGDADFYYDTGSVIEINASRPVPTPCGIDCPQIQFNGFTGDVEMVSQFICNVTMDTEKEVTVVYVLTEGNPSPSPSPFPEVKGDVNEDGSVDIIDALLVAQYYVGLSVTINTEAADADCSGTINIIDALLIAQFYVGSITEFCS
ncbi:MAG: dockerin type I repeat-containing protein [Spirochaetales bacterium]|nr:dockerin type I repeat-containing protein [Spirochaetales bacterium]